MFQSIVPGDWFAIAPKGSTLSPFITNHDVQPCGHCEASFERDGLGVPLKSCQSRYLSCFEMTQSGHPMGVNSSFTFDEFGLNL